MSADALYVALDLELVGSPEDGQEIVEVGAVRFRGAETLATFQTLVRPEQALSAKVRALTGIQPEELRAAPPFRAVAEQVRSFVGDLPIVGQSIQLDVEALRRAGLVLRNPLLDTYELATLLLPRLPSYDLATIAGALGLEDGRPHRALPDALLAMRVFQALVARIEALDPDILMHVNRLAAPGWPFRPLFAEAERRRTREYLRATLGGGEPPGRLSPLPQPLAPPARPRQPLTPNSGRTPLDVAQVTAALRAGGALAETLRGFEDRPEQQRMARAVAEAFNRGEHLLVEAGTGTGKSLAYLVPAVQFAVANNRRVVVSTNTINLQDQLFEKDLPDLRRATGLEFKACVLKGRSNYLCLKRLYLLLRAEHLEPEERSLLIKVLLWLPQTETGDRAELRLVGREEEAWSKLSAQSEICTPPRCPYHRAGVCFLARARRAAEESHVVVVNHALLLSDIVTESKVLPDYQHLIVDEAHHLEDEATAQLGWRLTLRDLLVHCDELWEPSGVRATGLLPEAIGYLHGQTAAPAARAALVRLAESAERDVRETRETARALFGALERFVSGRTQRNEVGQPTLRLTGAVRAQPAWSEVEQRLDDLLKRLDRIERHVYDLVEKLGEVAAHDELWEELVGRLAAQQLFWDVTRTNLAETIGAPSPKWVSWAAGFRAEDLALHRAPVHVGELLAEALWRTKECVVLTSATLTTDGSFRYVRDRLGLERVRELALGSPFDYERAALVYVPTDLPEPNQPLYQRGVEEAIYAFALALEGRTLVLFTSHSQLRTTYDALRDRLSAARIVLLAQRLDGMSRARLLETFKAGNRTVLFGTASFWEGIDVVGEALSGLVITRLPFAVPTDPVYEARSEQFDDPFNQYAVPQAILRFKQGFGRLIRSRTDRGVLLVLDRRLISKGYGAAFRRSLPKCTVEQGPIAAAARRAAEWLARPSLPAGPTPPADGHPAPARRREA